MYAATAALFRWPSIQSFFPTHLVRNAKPKYATEYPNICLFPVVDIIVCKSCGPVVKKGELHFCWAELNPFPNKIIGEALVTFQEEKEKSQKHTLVYFHGIMQEIIGGINTLLPRYSAILLAPSPTVNSLKVRVPYLIT